MQSYKFTATTNMIQHPDQQDLQEAKDWAYGLTNGEEKYFILDTETTGLGDAEIVDICVMTRWGQPLLSTLVKPSISIPSNAVRIHGITDEMVADAPTFPDIYPKLKQLIEGKKVVIYNKSFDCNIIHYCCDLHDLPQIQFDSECAMLWYAQYYGAWNSYYGNYKWQKLPGGGEHRALADCRAVYRLLHRMAERQYSQPQTPSKQFPPIQLACLWQEKGHLCFYWRRKLVKEWKIKLPIFYILKDNTVIDIDGEPDVDDVPW